MPSSVVSGHLSSGHDFVAPMELPSSLSTSSAFTSSTSNLRKEGKSPNATAFNWQPPRHTKHMNAYELSKGDTAKHKRSAYSSRYALSLMDLFTSSNGGGGGTAVPPTSRPTNPRCAPSYTAQANAIISNVPACSTAPSLSTFTAFIEQKVTLGMASSPFSVHHPWSAIVHPLTNSSFFSTQETTGITFMLSRVESLATRVQSSLITCQAQWSPMMLRSRVRPIA